MRGRTPCIPHGVCPPTKSLVTLLSGISALVGAVITKVTCDRSAKKHEDEIRTQIANELRTKVLNDPLHVEQSGYQAMMKDNAKDHEDIFKRLRNNESAIATLMERSISQGKTLDRMADQVGSLYDRIICRGGKKK